MRYLSLLSLLFLILLLSLAQSVSAQRLIRRSSRHYVEAQTLPERVEPMLHDDWYQDAPNNNMCPLDRNGDRSLVGCVATAMTEVMYYWKWPVQGEGSYTYNDSTGCGQVLSADFSSHTYDWDNVLNHYEEGQYTQQQADAIALPSLDCGIAVNMRYGAGSSAARSIRQPMALVNYFGYDCGLQMHFRDFYSLAEITLMLKKELAAGRPVLISGTNPISSHAFVIDGYDEQDRFHTHFGNPGNGGDGWTYLPHMLPDMPLWYEKDTHENGYNILQMFTTGVMPAHHPEATGIERHSFAFQYVAAVTDSLHPEPLYSRNQVPVTVHDLSNVGWNLHRDSVVLMLRQGDELVCPLHVYQRDFLLEEIDDTTYTDTLLLKMPSDLADGAYTIMPMYRDNALEGGKEWREAMTCAGTPNYLIADVQGETVTLSSDTASTAFLTLEDSSIPDMIVNGTPPNLSLTFRCHNAEMAGRFYLLMENLKGGPSFYLQRQGLTLTKDEVSQRIFRKGNTYAPSLGQYRLHVLYEANLFADELIELPLPEDKIITILSATSIELAEE